MSRLTINISTERHKALKAAAARRGTTIGQIVDASLDAYGIKSERNVSELLARARAHSRLETGKAEALAVEETRKARR
ncbi:MAG TPA: plasmid partition protein ParG [Gammaproteobacteria bacterium]|nr:plasmid partition protein ParG [Gammaproteobacteria bacterium]